MRQQLGVAPSRTDDTTVKDYVDAADLARAPIDTICNALGVSGSGLTTDDLTTALTSIPQANIPSLSSLVQNIFGSSTVGTTIAVSALPDLPASQITSGTFSATLIPNITQAMSTDLSSLVSALFGNSTISSTISTSAVPTGIPATSIAEVLGGGSISADLTNLATALFGSTAVTEASQVEQAAVSGLTDVWDWLTGNNTAPTTGSTVTASVAASAVPGIQGITDMATTVQSTWDNIATSVANALDLSGVASSGNSLSAVTSVLQSQAQATQTALTQATAATNTLNEVITVQPLYQGLSSNLITSTIPMSSISFTAIGLPTYGSTAGTAPIAFVNFPTDTTASSICFAASFSGTTTIPTGVYLNIYTMDSSGDLTLIYTSSNLASSIATGGNTSPLKTAWVEHVLSSEIDIASGTIWAIEMVSTASAAAGDVYVAAQEMQFPLWGASYPQYTSATRSFMTSTLSPSTIAAAGITYAATSNTNTPYFAINAAGTVPYYTPIQRIFLTSQTVTPPTWANNVDVIALGGGGGGGGGFDEDAGNGAPTTVSYGINTLTAAGGVGGSAGTSLGSSSYAYGASPGSETYNGSSYTGGTEVAGQQTGSSPGGGGGGGIDYGADTYGDGGSAGTFATATWDVSGDDTIAVTIGAGGTPGGGGYGAAAGASGAVWLRFYQ